MSEQADYHGWLIDAVNVWNWFRNLGGAHIADRTAQIPGGAWFAMQASLEKLARMPGAPMKFACLVDEADQPRGLRKAWTQLYLDLEEADQKDELARAEITFIA